MGSEKITVVSIAHEVTIKLPLPLNTIIVSFAGEGGAVEKITLVIGVTDNRRPPPIGQRTLNVIPFVRIAMRRKSVVIVVRIELHEK